MTEADRIKKMEQALKIIATWASVTKEPQWTHKQAETLAQIEEKAMEALRCQK